MIADHIISFPKLKHIKQEIHPPLSISYHQFRSEEDSEKYIRVIQMSKIIQTKLQALQFERKKNQSADKIQLVNNYLNKKHHKESTTTNTLNQDKQAKNCGNKYIFSSSTSSSYSNSYSDDNDLSIGADKRYSKELYTSKYHTYSEGSFSHLNKICANRFQLVMPPPSPPTPPPSADFINGKDEEENEEKMSRSESGEVYDDIDSQKQKDTENYSVSEATASSNEDDDDDDDDDSKDTCDSFLEYSSDEDEDDDDQVIQYDHLNPPKIHIAVRRDASLFKIEKISRENMAPAFNLAEVPKISNLTQKAEIDDEQNWVFSVPSTAKKTQVSPAHLNGGMFTPPESPECQYNDDDDRLDNNMVESDSYKIDDDLCFIHVQKKAHQSLKSFITGTYQLNHLTVTKVNSSISPYPGLHSAIDNSTRKSKLLLKVAIIALNEEACEKQRRFGFTFWWHKSVSNRNQEQRLKLQDEAKFAIAPDSLVKESLLTWIDSQNEAQGEGIQLPCLSKADSIMRDGKKIYIVYDPSLFLV